MNAHTPTHASRTGSTIHLLGTLVTFRASATDTGGAFSLVEIAVAPGAGTPPHRHEDAESFLVLDGEIAFSLDNETVLKQAGGFIHLPAGLPHAFRNPSNRPARMLGLNMPGGPHESFFAEIGEPVVDASSFPVISPPDIPRLVAVAQRHGITILPPA